MHGETIKYAKYSYVTSGFRSLPGHKQVMLFIWILTFV